MPHKITLTGKPVSSLCQKGAYYTFDMEESGSPGPPKGLPSSSTITYTAFINSRPNPEKTQQVVDYVKRTGYLDEPIIINRETKILTDGYRRYIVAKKVKMDVVPVAYEKISVESFQ